jgi:hypothetical protein
MTKLSIVLAAVALASLIGCGKSTECRCAPPDLGEDDSGPEGVDAGPCAHLTPPRELPMCGEALARTGESLGRGAVTDGPATVSAVTVASDGSVELTVRQEGGATRILELPSDPGLVMDDAVDLAVDGTGVALVHEDDFMAYEGGLANASEHVEALRRAVDTGRSALVLGPVEGELEPLCAVEQSHHSPSFCADVAQVSFGLRLGDTVVSPGERVELTFDAWSLVVLNRSITQRDDRYATDCTQCADYWVPSIDVAIVAQPAP